MGEPFFTIPTICIGMASSYLCKAVNKGVSQVISSAEVNRRINDTKKGLFPANHRIERGVHRAALCATSHIFAEITNEEALYKKEKALYKKGERPSDEINGWLKEHIGKLGWEKYRGYKNPKRELALETIAFNVNFDAHKVAQDAITIQAGTQIDDKPDNPKYAFAMAATFTAVNSYPLWLSGPKNNENETLKKELLGWFNARNEKWLKAFSIYFIQELVDDSELNVIFLHLQQASIGENFQKISTDTDEIKRQTKTIHKDICDRFKESEKAVIKHRDEILGAIAKVEQTLILLAHQVEKLENTLKEDRNIFSQSLFDMPNVRGDGSMKDLHYTAKKDEFIGRRREIKAITEGLLKPVTGKLTEENRFKWMVLSGKGGMGKSRLAYKLIEDYKIEWPYSGFVKKYALEDKMSPRKYFTKLTLPTFIVIDYTVRSAHLLPEFILACADISRDMEHPLRLLILTRRDDDDLFQLIRRDTDYGRIIKDSEVHDQTGDILKLTNLSEGDSLKLMRYRMALARQDMQDAQDAAEEKRKEEARDKDTSLKAKKIAPIKLVQIEDQELKNIFSGFDKHGRPLFAAIVAKAIQEDWFPKGENNDKGKSNTRGSTQDPSENQRLELCEHYLLDQKRNHWEVCFENMAKDEAKKKEFWQHMNLLRLSTMLGGLSENQLKALDKDDASWFPQPKSAVQAMDRAASGFAFICDNFLRTCTEYKSPEEGSEANYDKLEPDMIGERLVLLQKIKGHDDKLLSPKEIVRIGFKIDVDAVFRYLQLCRQDYFWTTDRLELEKLRTKTPVEKGENK